MHQDIEHLSDPTASEIRIASPLAIAFTVIPNVLERFAKESPRVIVYFDDVASASATRDFRALVDRKYDLMLGRGGTQGRRSPGSEGLTRCSEHSTAAMFAAMPDVSKFLF